MDEHNPFDQPLEFARSFYGYGAAEEVNIIRISVISEIVDKIELY